MNGNFDKEIREIFLDDIIPNRFQPRLNFDEKSLLELAESIKQHGIIQPLVLRRLGDKYEIIAGERRFKASQIAGLTKVPALIADLDDNSSAEVAIVENLHRKEMSSLEEAKSFKKLLERGITQEQLGIRLGKSQSYIANKLRLLSLSEAVQNALVQEQISERHARSLLSVKDSVEQQNILNEIISRKLTVKETDELIKERFGEEEVDELILQPELSNNKSADIMSFNLEDLKKDKPIQENIYEQENIPKPTNSQEVINNQPFIQTQPVLNNMENNEINVPKPFVLIDENLNKTETIPEPHRNTELNPQLNLINKLSDPNETSESISFKETIGTISSPYVIPKADIETDYLKPRNIFDVEEIKNNAQNVNQETKTSFDINQLLISDSKQAEIEPNNVQPTEETAHQNKFIMNLNEQPKTISENKDINNSKEMIKTVLDTIKNSGVKIDYEEFDFERLYQIIIKIDK